LGQRCTPRSAATTGVRATPTAARSSASAQRTSRRTPSCPRTATARSAPGAALCHSSSTLALAVVGCRSLAIYTVILLPLLSPSVEMTVSPSSTRRRLRGYRGGPAAGPRGHLRAAVERDGRDRARSGCRFAPPLIHVIPESSNMLSACSSETTVRPNPRSAPTRSGTRCCSRACLRWLSAAGPPGRGSCRTRPAGALSSARPRTPTALPSGPAGLAQGDAATLHCVDYQRLSFHRDLQSNLAVIAAIFFRNDKHRLELGWSAFAAKLGGVELRRLAAAGSS
jgi:hypothetical protein